MKNSYRFLKYLMLIVIGVFILSCDDKNNIVNNEEKIQGRLVDEQGNAIPGTGVEVFNNSSFQLLPQSSDTTDEDGYFTLLNLPKDISHLSVNIKNPDFKIYSRKLNDFIVQTTEPVHLLHQDSCIGTLKIKTYKATDSSALNGVEIRLYRSGSLIRKDTSKNGIILFENVCPGNYIYRLYKSGFQHIYDSVKVNSEDSIIRSYYFVESSQDTCCNGVLKVFVKDSKTGYIPTHPPVITLLKNNQVLSYYTAQNGFVYFTKLCAGNYSVKITSPYYETLSWDYTSHCNAFDTVTKFLTPNSTSDSCCHGKVVVTIVDSANGQGVAGALVYVHNNGSSFSGTADSHGKVTFTGLCPGTYSFYYVKSGWSRVDSASWSYSLNCNDSVGFVKRLSYDTKCCNAQIIVNVKDTTTGNPVDSVYIHLSQNNQTVQSGMTHHGSYTFTNICEGTYSLYYSGKQGWFRTDSMSWNVNIKCHDTLSFTRNLMLKSLCCGGLIKGSVRDSTADTLLTNAIVILLEGNTTIATDTTNSSGNFEFDNVCQGSFKLYIYRHGYYGKSVNSIEIGCNDRTKEFVIRLRKN